MPNDYVKKLTGKIPQDFEFAAYHIINNSDIEAFSDLVEQSDFLFDFIKENVRKRFADVITNYNYKNLLRFLKIYSYDYEDFIIETLVKFADEDLTDKMLDLLENGTYDEKAYCAKYFGRINDTLAIDLLKKYSYSEFEPLAWNCAQTLSVMKDEESYNSAVGKLNSSDEFEKLAAVKFLVAYKDSKALDIIFKSMKTSSMPENIAAEIPYLKGFLELLDTEYKDDVVLALNYIISGFGEIIPISGVFNYQLLDILNKLFDIQVYKKDTKIAILLLNSKLKFEQLTENDEYIFDENKETKNEVYEIKNLLLSFTEKFWQEQTTLFQGELNENSSFIYSALEIVQELVLVDSFKRLKSLLDSSNQTIILKTLEVIKSLNRLNQVNKTEVLKNISNENIKKIIKSI